MSLEMHGAAERRSLPPPERDSPAPTFSSWGPLELREKVGTGGFGNVYRAWDPGLEREVALKLLQPKRGSSPEYRKSMVAEARLLARVRHPNVATVHGVAEHEGHVGLWMEFIHGKTLDVLIAEQGTFGAVEAASLGAAVCRALVAVHAAQLVHGDIKAQNVMREVGGRVVLMDFGLTRSAVRTDSDTLGGTPVYMAPELFEDGLPNVKTDIYSVGVLLYYLVTGSMPLEKSGWAAMREGHRLGQAKLLRDVRPDLPEAYLAAVDGCLTRDPRDRFDTVGQILQALSTVFSEVESEMRSTVEFQRPRRTRRARYLTIAGALACLLLVLVGAYWLRRDSRLSGESSTSSIAVLPFSNLTQNKDNEYLIDGLCDELISSLSAVPEVQVLARTTTSQFKNSQDTPEAIGRKLGVRSILTGSIRQNGSRIRVLAQLTDTKNGYVLWSQAFDEDIQHLATLHDNIAARLAQSPRLHLGRATMLTQTDERGSADPELYTLLLKGRYHASKFTRPEMLAGISYFKQALDRDPSYGRAWAGLAQTTAFLGMVTVPRDEQLVSEAKNAVSKALALDSSSADAYTAQGLVQTLFDWDFSGAENSFRTALRLNPSHAFAHFIFAGALSGVGRFPEALVEARRALELDPLSAIVNHQVAWIYFGERRFDESLDQARKTLEIDPGLPPAVRLVAQIDIETGRLRQARATVDRIAKVPGQEAEAKVMLAEIQALEGDKEGARAALAKVLADTAQQPQPISVALAELALGSRSRALDWLERSYRDRNPLALWIHIIPRLQVLRSEPRFQALIDRIRNPSLR